MHRLDRLRVEKKHLAVLQDVPVASVERRLYFDGRDGLPLGVEKIVDVEVAAGRVFYFYERQDRAHRIRQRLEFCGEVHLPSSAPQSG